MENRCSRGCCQLPELYMWPSYCALWELRFPIEGGRASLGPEAQIAWTSQAYNEAKGGATCSYTYLFNKPSLSSYYMPSTVLITWDVSELNSFVAVELPSEAGSVVGSKELMTASETVTGRGPALVLLSTTRVKTYEACDQLCRAQ